MQSFAAPPHTSIGR